MSIISINLSGVIDHISGDGFNYQIGDPISLSFTINTSLTDRDMITGGNILYSPPSSNPLDTYISNPDMTYLLNGTEFHSSTYGWYSTGEQQWATFDDSGRGLGEMSNWIQQNDTSLLYNSAHYLLGGYTYPTQVSEPSTGILMLIGLIALRFTKLWRGI